jgi:lysophospholipase L1-like esterase
MRIAKYNFINPVFSAFGGKGGIVLLAGLCLFLLVGMRPFCGYQKNLIMIQHTVTDTGGEKEGLIRHWLALGDSYTIGESVKESERYPVQAVRLLEKFNIHFKDPEIIAKTGWTTSDLLNGMNEKKPALQKYDLVTLLIGVNNQYREQGQMEYQEEFLDLLKRSIQLAGNRPAHVIVLSIPDYGVTPFARNLPGAAIAKQIDSFNRINQEASKNEQVNYLDITQESRKAVNDPSLIAGDGLHFSGKEYAIWAKMLVTLVQHKVNNPLTKSD